MRTRRLRRREERRREERTRREPCSLEGVRPSGRLPMLRDAAEGFPFAFMQ
jgi:hypothetical protein